jgi:FMN phosphatase YigB (HAD superfamily)
MNYKAIIFDLGGVLFNINYQLTAEAFKALGLKEFDTLYSQAAQNGLFDDFETGKSTPPEFRFRLRHWVGNQVTDDQIDSAWDAMLLGMPFVRLELLNELKKHYRLFLLSNTNEIHLKSVFRIMKEQLGFPDLSGQMEKQYYSCRVGLRKPDPEIFRLVLEENGLSPATTLFIDDSIQHIQGARLAGLNAYHLKSGEAVERLFPDLFVLGDTIR